MSVLVFLLVNRLAKSDSAVRYSNDLRSAVMYIMIMSHRKLANRVLKEGGSLVTFLRFYCRLDRLRATKKSATSLVEAEHVISKVTVQDDIVFDPMMGAATTGIPALRLKRRFIGIEKDQDSAVMTKGTIDRELSYIGSTK